MKSLLLIIFRVLAVFILAFVVLPLVISLLFPSGLFEDWSLAQALWTASFLALFFIGGQVLSIRELAKGKGHRISYDVVQERTIELDCDLDILKKAIEICDKLKVKSILKEDDMLVIRTKMSFMTWGEMINIRCISKDDIQKIKISSRPRCLAYNIIDFGQNFRNVNIIETLIKTTAGR